VPVKRPRTRVHMLDIARRCAGMTEDVHDME
jgi:hypothetical protein